MKLLWPKSREKAQTILEYMFVLSVVIVPLALYLRTYLKDSKQGANDNLIRTATNAAYGDGDNFGIIGRPYP